MTWREIRLLVEAGEREIVFDACNVRKIHREPIFMRFPGCEVIAVWVQTPIEVCKERRPDTETFTADIIDRMNDSFEPPTMEEGFKEIRIVRGFQNERKRTG